MGSVDFHAVYRGVALYGAVTKIDVHILGFFLCLAHFGISMRIITKNPNPFCEWE